MNLIEFFAKTMGVGVEEDPEDLIEEAQKGDPPHEDCTCIRCLFARGEMPSPPTKKEVILECIVHALEAANKTAGRSRDSGITESKELIQHPQSPELEAIMLKHRVDRYNASATAMRALNDMLPEHDRLPERLLRQPMTLQEAQQALAGARAKLAERLAKSVAKRAAKAAEAAAAAAAVEDHKAEQRS